MRKTFKVQFHPFIVGESHWGDPDIWPTELAFTQFPEMRISHALARDENRNLLEDILIRKVEGRVKQMAYPGIHGDV